MYRWHKTVAQLAAGLSGLFHVACHDSADTESEHTTITYHTATVTDMQQLTKQYCIINFTFNAMKFA